MSSGEEDKKKVVIQKSALVPEEEKERSSSLSKEEIGELGQGEPSQVEEIKEKEGEERSSEANKKGEEEEEKVEKEEEEKGEKEGEKGSSEANKKEKGARNISKRHGDGDGDGDDSDMSQLLNETIPWNIIDNFFRDNPNVLVAHQLDSYNEFISNGISQIFKEHNPIVFQKEKNQQTDTYKHVSRFYLGGKKGDKIYYGKPVIYDETVSTSRVHYMYPNEARLRNMTYGVTIHYDVNFQSWFIPTCAF